MENVKQVGVENCRYGKARGTHARGTHARGKSEEGLGDLTFLYTGWFYYVHLLRLLRTYYPKLPVGNRELLTGNS